MSKLNKYKVQHTIGGDIVIAELESKQEINGLSFLKDKSNDKSKECILAVMSYLKGKLDEGESSITVESTLGKLTFEQIK